MVKQSRSGKKWVSMLASGFRDLAYISRYMAYTGTSPTRNCLLLGTYSRTMPRVGHNNEAIAHGEEVGDHASDAVLESNPGEYHDQNSIRPSIRPICTRCCFTMTNMPLAGGHVRCVVIFVGPITTTRRDEFTMVKQSRSGKKWVSILRAHINLLHVFRCAGYYCAG